MPIVINSIRTVPKHRVEAIAEVNLDPNIITQMQKASLIKAGLGGECRQRSTGSSNKPHK